MTQFRVDGKVVIVTGAASGIGEATARVLADAGASVVGADIRSSSAVEALDVRDSGAVDAFVGSVMSRHGRLDGFANVAGIAHLSEVVDTRDEDLDRVLDVNLKGVFYGSRAAARAMRDAGNGGSIVNIASAAAYMGAAGLSCYAIAKAGVVTLSRTLANEVGRDGIRVNAIAPGLIVTPMTMQGGMTEDQVRERFSRNAALGRVGEPDDIANAVLYLMSDASSFMSGQVLHPNGGTIMAS